MLKPRGMPKGKVRQTVCRLGLKLRLKESKREVNQEIKVLNLRNKSNRCNRRRMSDRKLGLRARDLLDMLTTLKPWNKGGKPAHPLRTLPPHVVRRQDLNFYLRTLPCLDYSILGA